MIQYFPTLTVGLAKSNCDVLPVWLQRLQESTWGYPNIYVHKVPVPWLVFTRILPRILLALCYLLSIPDWGLATDWLPFTDWLLSEWGSQAGILSYILSGILCLRGSLWMEASRKAGASRLTNQGMPAHSSSYYLPNMASCYCLLVHLLERCLHVYKKMSTCV
jgi:hypothetical protein